MADEKIDFPVGVLKVRADGTQVLSSYLLPGETVYGDGMTYEEAKARYVNVPEQQGTVLWKEDSRPVGPDQTTLTVDETKTHGKSSGSVISKPKLTDSKADWYAYAVSKGYTGAEEDQTKQQLIDTYGAQSV